MNKSISKNAVFKAILNLCNIILPIIVMPVATNLFKPTDCMSYITKSETYNNFLIAFASFGVYQYGLRELSRVRDDKKKLSQVFTNLFLITSISSTLIFIGYSVFLYKFCINDPAFYTCVLFSLNIMFNIFYVEWVNEALENYDFITIKTMILKISYSIAVLFFIKQIEDFNLYVYLGVGVNILNNLSSFFYIRKYVNFDFSDINIKRYVKPMFLVVILSNSGLLYTQLDRIMIGTYCSPTDLTCYGSIAQKSITIINTLVLTVIQVSMPRLSNTLGNNKKDSYNYLLNKVIKIYFLILFPASIGLFTLSKHVMYIFGQDTYIPWTSIMQVFSLYMITVGIQGIISNEIIYLHKQEKSDVKIFFIGGICNLIFNFLILYAGIFNGATAIFTTMLSNIIVIILEYRFVKKHISTNIHLFSFDNMKYLYYSLIFIPVTYIIDKIIPSIIYSCIINIGLCGILYVLILMITKDETFLFIYNKFYLKMKSYKAHR